MFQNNESQDALQMRYKAEKEIVMSMGKKEGRGEEGKRSWEGRREDIGLDTRRESEALRPHWSTTLLNDLVSPPWANQYAPPLYAGD